MFSYISQPALLRAALAKRGLSREELAYAIDVSLRAVHRWLVEEENQNYRAMSPVQLQEVLYWLAGQPNRVEFRLPRSLTGLKQLQAADKHARQLGEEAKKYEKTGRKPSEENGYEPDLRADFMAARARLAWIKANALAFASPPEGQALPDWIEVTGDEPDPIFVIKATEL